MVVDHESVPADTPSSLGCGLVARAPNELGGLSPPIRLPGRSFVGVEEREPGVGLVTRGSIEARDWRRELLGEGGAAGMPVPVYFFCSSVREKMAWERDD